MRIKRNGEQCKRNARKGSTVCDAHGGRAPQIRNRAEQRVLEAKVRDKLGDELPSEPVNVLRELDRLLKQVLTMKDRLGELIAARGADLSAVELGLLERSLDRAGNLLIAAARLDLAGRLSRMDAQLVDEIRLAFENFAQRLGRDPDEVEVQQAMIAALRSVSGG